MTMGSRLRSAREAKRLDVATVAERLKISEGAVRHHENGTRAPKTKTIADYSRMYGVAVDWIMRGLGKGPGGAGLTETTEYMDIWDAIPESERGLVLDVLRPFAKRAKSTKKGE